MLLGYNTNGLAHHRLTDAIDLLADEGYRSVALTLDVGALDPYAVPRDLDRQVGAVRERLDRHGLIRVVETGARYLLNPRKKHDPTLLDPDPARRALRVDFLRRAIDLADRLEAPVVSIWSGVLPVSESEAAAFDHLVEGLEDVLRHAETRGVTLGFEPEPGMFVDTFARFQELDERIRHPLFQLTIDVGHVHCLESGPVGDHIRAWGGRLVNVHIEDMARGVHEHLMFGDGTVDFPDAIAALRDVDYQGGLNVELSRHSHKAVEAVLESAAFLRARLAWSLSQ
jgi:L-ribulose-5-phosphate 3-epimerase